MDHRAKKGEVATGTEGQPIIRHRRGAREARIAVNDLRAVLLSRLDDPLKSDGMILRHRLSHEEDCVGIGEILLRGRRAAPPKRGAQTGHRGAMSYSGLI